MFKRLVILKIEFVIMYVIIIKIYLIAYVYMKFHSADITHVIIDSAVHSVRKKN